MKTVFVVMLTAICLQFVLSEQAVAGGCNAKLECFCQEGWQTVTHLPGLTNRHPVWEQVDGVSVNGHKDKHGRCVPNVHQLKDGARLCFDRKCPDKDAAMAEDCKSNTCIFNKYRDHGQCFILH